MIDLSGEERIGETTTVTIDNDSSGAFECLTPGSDLFRLEIPIEEDERIIAQLVAGYSVLDVAESDSIVSLIE
ncbi:hypothetical protein ACFQER_05380 [Halomicroarcula sp. GCM10025894]